MRVLLVNDDGPPAPHSPHILGLYETLRRTHPTWDISVVLPSSQKSWGSMAFTLQPPCAVWYYYPQQGDHDGQHAREHAGAWSSVRRPVADNEVGEWMLVDGSPTTCTNIGLHTLHALQPRSSSSSSATPTVPAFDLVLSGPNFGRNTGNAFSLCSGTVGAALAASLSGVRAVSLSYAHFQQPTPAMEEALVSAAAGATEGQQKALPAEPAARPWGQLPPSATPAVVQRAHELACQIVAKLWAGWEAGVGVYTINVPLSALLQDHARLRIYWTRTWESRFGPLYAVKAVDASERTAHAAAADGASSPSPGMQEKRQHDHKPSHAPPPEVSVRFAPNMASMLRPTSSKEAEGTDIWAVENGHVSIARLSPSYTAVVPAMGVGAAATAGGSDSATSAGAAGPGTIFKL